MTNESKFPIKQAFWGFVTVAAFWVSPSFIQKALASENAPCVPVSTYVRAVGANDGVVVAVLPSTTPLYDSMILSKFQEDEVNLIALVYDGCVLQIPIAFPSDVFEGVNT